MYLKTEMSCSHLDCLKQYNHMPVLPGPQIVYNRLSMQLVIHYPFHQTEEV